MDRSIAQPTSPPPSRLDNPFATCWTRPGALPFRFAEGHSAAGLVAKLAAHAWRGEIIGPHGSGKSTLLAALKPALVAAGCRVHAISLREGERRLPRSAWDWLAIESRGQRVLVIVDGYEQLRWWERAKLMRRADAVGVGLVVSSHEPTGLPTLVRLAPDRELIEQLVSALCARAPTGVTAADVAASHACHGANVREIFFALYDRHERLRRESQTRGVAQT
jgi:hypothetical protein